MSDESVSETDRVDVIDVSSAVVREVVKELSQFVDLDGEVDDGTAVVGIGSFGLRDDPRVIVRHARDKVVKVVGVDVRGEDEGDGESSHSDFLSVSFDIIIIFKKTLNVNFNFQVIFGIKLPRLERLLK